ncbi:uncharacterized protein KGF55_000106 [Candida pseudojiufengensis]|uniref:uncharacterized protein n=1 Tax=Candida pseudojiufengensis TaxID=497109 RepID=UPI002224B6BF|nr:uncharacterized protein KGF55_000106 [Candida pseudojiufengensis]KAI5966697.1 hypothetical protein KGF55_000106 [Candida pseudojiufengensis]
MEKLIYFPINVLEMIFQEINHHMALSLMPLHSKFNEIGQKKLYKNIHLYCKDELMKNNRREVNKPMKGRGKKVSHWRKTNNVVYKQGYEWRAHKDILNDFTKKFTVISSCTFSRNIIRKKMIRNQHIQHLSIEKVHPVEYTGYMLYGDRNGVPALLKEVFRYFKNIDYVSFASLNNQFEMKSENSSVEVLKSLEFLVPKYIPGFYGRILFLEKNDQGPFDFLYDNLKSLKFSFEGSTIRRHNDDLSEKIELFNKISSFKNLEDLHLQFEALIDLTDSSFVSKLNKINCKLKKLNLIFWGKLGEKKKFCNGEPTPKWLFTLKDFFDTEHINSLSLYYENDGPGEIGFFYHIFEFKEILVDANLANLRNLALFSHDLDLRAIKVKKLHKLMICTDIANDEDATEIAKLYLKNPTLRLSWWPRFIEVYFSDIFSKIDNLQIFTPDYFQIISCQWPSYFFKNDIISIEKGRSNSHEQNKKNSKKLDIVLKTDYSIEELYGMDLFDTTKIDEDLPEVFYNKVKYWDW